MNKAVLEASGVNAFYGKNQVLRDVSFSAEEGTVTALLGANGSGKSTLLRLLAGLRPEALTTCGLLRIGDFDMSRLERRAAARLAAYTSQNESASWAYTVNRFVLMGRYARSGYGYSKEDEEVRVQKIALLGLESLAERAVTELSGGEFQRAVLARSLAQESRVLLLDEPVSALDIRHQYRLMNVLRNIVSSEGPAALVSLHDINLASLFADRLLVLRGGELIAQGSPEDVIREDVLNEAYGIRFGLYRHPQKNLPQVYVAE